MDPQLFRELFEVLVNHPFLISFIAGLFLEEGVIALSFLSAHTPIPLWTIALISPLGLLSLDLFIFWIGKTRFLGKIKKRAMEVDVGLPSEIKKFYKIHPLRAIALSKFIYGTRAILILIVSLGGLKYRKFIFYEIVSLYLWASIMVPLGWLAGIGFTKGLDLAKDFSTILAVALLFVFAIYLANKLIIHKYIRKRI